MSRRLYILLLLVLCIIGHGKGFVGESRGTQDRTERQRLAKGGILLPTSQLMERRFLLYICDNILKVMNFSGGPTRRGTGPLDCLMIT